jgi:hypothetical protein
MRNITLAKNKMERVARKIGNRRLSMPSICRHLNNEFNSMSVKFRNKKGDFFSVSGHYSGSRWDGDDDLMYNILIIYDQKTYKVSKDFYQEIFIALIHEFRHGYQHRKRRHKNINKKAKYMDKRYPIAFSYLTDYDEIDAHAYEVAHVFRNYIQDTSNRHITASWVINRYRKIVAKYDEKLYNRFLKKVYIFAHK